MTKPSSFRSGRTGPRVPDVTGSSYRLREARDDDMEALYVISLMTGDAGADASGVYEDPKLIGQIYSVPYLVLSEGLCRVVETEQRVVGFAAGTVDTRRFEAALEARWWPLLRNTYPEPPLAARADWKADQRRAHMIHHPARVPDAVVSAYSAHLHVNLLPEVQGLGIGPRLVKDMLLRFAGVGVHVGVNYRNARALDFWRRQGFAPIEATQRQPGRTRWLGRLAHVD